MKKFNIAIVGATGNVGREIINILHQRNFPIKKLDLIASKNSQGHKIKFGKNYLIVKNLDNYNFKNIDVVLSSPGSKISEKFVPIATKCGAIVIDNTSYYRMEKDVPLIVPEVNLNELKKFKKKKIISNPNCSTIQMVTALKPIHDKFKIKRIVVSTYQSTSGAGKSAMDELFHQTLDVYRKNKIQPTKFTKNIAFNVIPHIDEFLKDGQTKEEWKMEVETKKILDSRIKVSATCVRVPVFVGHGESINIETEKPINYSSATKILKKARGISVVDDRKNGGYITPDETSGEDDVFVSRIRNDASVKNGLALWVVSDNLRKGAALNSVQIAEELIKIL
tara:strand:+ start:1285 stop:2295 length:1011 start_codon:yes stop_codon:yes gene_type:complete